MSEPVIPERFKVKYEQAMKLNPAWERVTVFTWNDIISMFAAEAKVAELEAQRDASTPHRNRDYSTNPITDERLAQMCDETRWWKTDGDEIYRVVHELKDVRAKVAALTEALQSAHDSYYSRRPLESVIGIINAAIGKQDAK